MVPLKIQTLQNEVETWMRALQGLQVENLALKHELAKVLSNGINEDYLPLLEYYNNFFIEEDRVLLLFFNDVKYHKQMLLQPYIEKKVPEALVIKRHEKIRQEITMMKTVFYKKKLGFTKLITTLA